MAQQAQELAAVDARLKQRLADARTAIGERFSRQIADYRSSLRKSRGSQERLAAMQRVLSALEPLERPAVPPAPEMRAMTIPSPAQIAASAGSHSAPLKTEAEIAAMKQQRAKTRAIPGKGRKTTIESPRHTASLAACVWPQARS